MRLLFAEDDELIGRSVVRALTSEGYAVDWVTDGDAAQAALACSDHDLLLLDLGLPRCSGMHVLASARDSRITIPILILTARNTIDDRIIGLDAGADDYLAKPFSLDELSARIRALLRRRDGRTKTTLRHLGISLDPVTRKVKKSGNPIELSKREFSLLQTLLMRPEVVISRDTLASRIYGWSDDVSSNTIEVYICSLRRKLGNEFIVTVRGSGYRLAETSSSEKADS